MPRTRPHDEDEDESSPEVASPRRARTTESTAAPKGKVLVSLDDEDAFSGLFGSGPARIEESMWAPFAPYDNAIVWLLTLSRGTGKDREQYDQPYTIGRGWSIDKEGDLYSKAGYQSLPKNCNAIQHLVIPLKAALREAKIPIPNLVANPRILEGMDIVVERVEQVARNIQDTRASTSRRPTRQRDASEGPKTILEIREVISAPWDEGKTTALAPGPRRTRKATPVPVPEPEEEPEATTDALDEEAVEALLAVVEAGKVRTGEDLEVALEKQLGKHRQAAAIIDRATSKTFLAKQLGWVVSRDGKWIDVAE